MIRYILECMAFQLLFLIVYDFFLKRETFFQWNRVYLIGTFVLSLLLPRIKIEALKTTVSPEYFVYPEYLWGMDMSEGVVVAPENPTSFDLSATEILFYGGMFIAALLFAYKLYQINRLKARGEIRYFENFTRVVVRNSTMAFSFFRSIFLGDKVLEKDHESIIQHELVHIGQWHSWDLMFFELMRIIGWFNPLVYVYQNRVSELHEFIADANVAKNHKSEQYQLLLSQVFKTQHISFINPFFKSSLIKKRIVMLQKSKSKKVWQLKYLLLLPLLVGILVYTSLEAQENGISGEEQTAGEAELKKRGQLPQFNNFNQDGIIVPFVMVEKAPIFPGCQEEENIRDCFSTMMQKHISKNFIYPKEAQEKGIQGIVDITFVIQKDGNIGNVRMSSPDKTLETEAARIISLLPQMAPGEHKGEKVGVDYSVPIVFKVNGDGTFARSSSFNLTNSVAKYNALVLERNRLLQNFDERNPAITSIDQQLESLRNQMNSEMSLVSIEINEQLKELSRRYNENNSGDIPFSEVEKVPIFPGCEDADNKRACFQQQMQKYISENFRYPQEAREKGVQGRVNVLFVIQKDGSIGNVRMRSPDKILEDEAVRIISLLPQMTPGEHHGEKVRVAYSVPITFMLEGKEEFGARRNDDGSVDVPFAIIEKVPVFPGCEDASDMRACFNEKLQQHIAKNFRYPQEAQEKDIQGRVNILFFIQEDGSIGNIKMRGPDKLLEDEAERIISLLPQMTPGEHRGEKVRVPFSIPINFRLQGPKENEALQSVESGSVSNMMSVMAYIKKVGAKEFLHCLVSDETKGLPGVNVSIQGRNETMVTDFYGIIEIEVQKGDVLIFQYKGLPTTMLTVTDQQKYHITNK